MPYIKKRSGSKKPPTEQTSKQCLNRYRRHLKVCKIKFPCPGCNKPMLPIQFPNHAKSCLNLNSFTQCVWCLGKHTWIRRYKGKGENVKHLFDCFDACPFRQTPPLPPPPGPSFHYTPLVTTTPTQQLFGEQPLIDLGELDDNPFPDPSMDPCMDFDHPLFEQDFASVEDPSELPLCPERELFGRSKIDSLPDLAYELFQVLDMPPVTLFQNEHLNLAAACVRAYIQLRDTHDFFHCMVRAVDFPEFLDAMQVHAETFMLPFSAWCDGGRYEEVRHRHHRHMLLVAPAGRFHAEVWKHIRSDRTDVPIDPQTGQPMKGFKFHLKLDIKSPLHLVHALGYVSK